MLTNERVEFAFKALKREMYAFAKLADRVIGYRSFCEVWRKYVVAQYMLDDAVGIMQGLDFAALGFVYGKMVVTAYPKSAVFQRRIYFVNVMEHCRFKLYKRLFVALGKPAAQMRLIQRLISKHLVKREVYHWMPSYVLKNGCGIFYFSKTARCCQRIFKSFADTVALIFSPSKNVIFYKF